MAVICTDAQVARDTVTVEAAVGIILASIGEDCNREGLRDTPKRVAQALKELFPGNTEPELTFFDSNGYDQMVVVRDIAFYSFCEHHFLPFFGTVTVGYLPGKKIVGLSKIPRLVEFFSHRLNTQEYFTQNIANYLENKLQPLGCGVRVKARHLCQEMRGIKKIAEMSTCCLKGDFLSGSAKMEFLGI